MPDEGSAFRILTRSVNSCLGTPSILLRGRGYDVWSALSSPDWFKALRNLRISAKLAKPWRYLRGGEISPAVEGLKGECWSVVRW